jgi:hypothetical protein
MPRYVALAPIRRSVSSCGISEQVVADPLRHQYYIMAEVFVEFSGVIVGDSGVQYRAHACGAPTPDGMWHGWVEFIPVDGGDPIRSGRETTQPNRADTAYWATGLTAVYLEGALRRALNPVVGRPTATDVSRFDEPAPAARTAATRSATPDAVLDPFAVYEKQGEALLRRQLAALAAWHLVNIVEKYELSDEPPAVLSRLPAAALIDRIVAAVRSEELPSARRTGRGHTSNRGNTSRE